MTAKSKLRPFIDVLPVMNGRPLSGSWIRPLNVRDWERKPSGRFFESTA
jgi:hypothetical protein